MTRANEKWIIVFLTTLVISLVGIILLIVGIPSRWDLIIALMVAAPVVPLTAVAVNIITMIQKGKRTRR